MSSWKFSELEYKRPDFEAVRQGLKDSAEAIRKADTFETAYDSFESMQKKMSDLETQMVIASVRHTIDTSDEYYETENAYLDETVPTIMPEIIAFNDSIAQGPHRAAFEEKFGPQWFRQMELEKRSFSEQNIPLLQEEAKLTEEYQKMMASCRIPFDGKELNLYGIQKYFEHEDRSVRRAAFRAYGEFYHQNEPRLEEIWDELIRNRNQQGKNLGFENYIPVGYMKQGRTDYGQEDVAAFREQVRTVLVPECEKLYHAQADRIGVDEIYFYDESRVFPDGNAVPAGDDDFMMEQAQKMYHELSPETGEFIDFMVEHELLDLKNRPNKASTGYMTHLSSYLAPFVFSCFNSTIGDMMVLTHELGHAFAGYRAMRKQILTDYYSESTDIAEIHSMSMEQFAYPYAERFFGSDAEKYRFQHLQEAITFVPFGTAVDEFQHICYANPELTPKERTMEWHKLEEKYMPWRKYDGDDEFMQRGGMWYHKLHIYLYPFYYINYTLTTMGAMEFKKKMAEDPEKAWKDYLALCDVGGSVSYLETLKLADLRVPFEEGAVETAVSYALKILDRQMQEF